MTIVLAAKSDNWSAEIDSHLSCRGEEVKMRKRSRILAQNSLAFRMSDRVVILHAGSE